MGSKSRVIKPCPEWCNCSLSRVSGSKCLVLDNLLVSAPRETERRHGTWAEGKRGNVGDLLQERAIEGETLDATLRISPSSPRALDQLGQALEVSN